MKGKEKPKPNSTRVCLSAIVDIFIRHASKAETQWEIRTSQPKLTVKSQTVKRSAPHHHHPPPPAPCYNTQMDCHIRFRCIGYYTLGLLFPTHPSGWRDWVWGLSLLVLFPRFSKFLISLIEHTEARATPMIKWWDNIWKMWPVLAPPSLQHNCVFAAASQSSSFGFVHAKMDAWHGRHISLSQVDFHPKRADYDAVDDLFFRPLCRRNQYTVFPLIPTFTSQKKTGFIEQTENGGTWIV